MWDGLIEFVDSQCITSSCANIFWDRFSLSFLRSKGLIRFNQTISYNNYYFLCGTVIGFGYWLHGFEMVLVPKTSLWFRNHNFGCSYMSYCEVSKWRRNCSRIKLSFNPCLSSQAVVSGISVSIPFFLKITLTLNASTTSVGNSGRRPSSTIITYQPDHQQKVATSYTATDTHLRQRRGDPSPPRFDPSILPSIHPAAVASSLR